MPDATPDTEFTLTHGPYALTCSPYGASLRGLTHEGRSVIAGYHGVQNQVGAQGDVLVPFPGRVRAGRYAFEGRQYQMPLNDTEGPNAIHGFLRSQMWETECLTSDSAAFRAVLAPDQHPGYPFSLSVRLVYSLTDTGLTTRIAFENSGVHDAPVAAGFHPYFTLDAELIDADVLQVPFDAYQEYDGLLPTGRILPVEDSPYDFREPRPIKDLALNTCFVSPRRDSDGLCRLRLSSADNARALTVWMDAAFNYVVLYSGDPLPASLRRRALAIEPMTCGSDAFNHPAWGLVTLAPGQELTGSWGVRRQ